jgi:hypothetical protein
VGFAALTATILAAAAWTAFFVVAVDEDCGRLDDCGPRPDVLLLVAWSATAVAVVLAVVWLRRWVATRGREASGGPTGR